MALKQQKGGKKPLGFSLIEIMVAIGLLAVLSAGITMVVVQIMKTARFSRGAVDTQATLLDAASRMSRDTAFATQILKATSTEYAVGLQRGATCEQNTYKTITDPGTGVTSLVAVVVKYDELCSRVPYNTTTPAPKSQTQYTLISRVVLDSDPAKPLFKYFNASDAVLTSPVDSGSYGLIKRVEFTLAASSATNQVLRLTTSAVPTQDPGNAPTLCDPAVQLCEFNIIKPVLSVQPYNDLGLFLSLTWVTTTTDTAAAPLPTSYLVYRDGGNPVSVPASACTTTPAGAGATATCPWNDTNVGWGETHAYRVFANQTGGIVGSNTTTGTRRPAPPTLTGARNTLVLTWAQPAVVQTPGAPTPSPVTYDVYRSGSDGRYAPAPYTNQPGPNGPQATTGFAAVNNAVSPPTDIGDQPKNYPATWALVNAGNPTLTYGDAAATAGEIYVYRVCAKNPAVNESCSAPIELDSDVPAPTAFCPATTTPPATTPVVKRPTVNPVTNANRYRIIDLTAAGAVDYDATTAGSSAENMSKGETRNYNAIAYNYRGAPSTPTPFSCITKPFDNGSITTTLVPNSGAAINTFNVTFNLPTGATSGQIYSILGVNGWTPLPTSCAGAVCTAQANYKTGFGDENTVVGYGFNGSPDMSSGLAVAPADYPAGRSLSLPVPGSSEPVSANTKARPGCWINSGVAGTPVVTTSGWNWTPSAPSPTSDPQVYSTAQVQFSYPSPPGNPAPGMNFSYGVVPNDGTPTAGAGSGVRNDGTVVDVGVSGPGTWPQNGGTTLGVTGGFSDANNTYTGMSGGSLVMPGTTYRLGFRAIDPAMPGEMGPLCLSDSDKAYPDSQIVSGHAKYWWPENWARLYNYVPISDKTTKTGDSSFPGNINRSTNQGLVIRRFSLSQQTPAFDATNLPVSSNWEEPVAPPGNAEYEVVTACRSGVCNSANQGSVRNIGTMYFYEDSINGFALNKYDNGDALVRVSVARCVNGKSAYCTHSVNGKNNSWTDDGDDVKQTPGVVTLTNVSQSGGGNSGDIRVQLDITTGSGNSKIGEANDAIVWVDNGISIPWDNNRKTAYYSTVTDNDFVVSESAVGLGSLALGDKRSVSVSYRRGGTAAGGGDMVSYGPLATIDPAAGINANANPLERFAVYKN
jgi:prepilin-type N-terminal cleavage/methylation domain-containing protein